MSVPVFGPPISTPVVTAVGTGEGFDRGRDLSAWLGLVPDSTAPASRWSS
ncbi:MAG: transposase [Blastocatellia bacterium]